MAKPASRHPEGTSHTATNPKIMVITFVILTFLFSSVFWYLTSQTALVKENATLLMIYAVGAMWCPALAAVSTRLYFQRNLKGFGTGLKKPVWIAAGIGLPVIAGLIMFGTAWLTGIAPVNTANIPLIFAVSFIPGFFLAIAFNCFAAAGEEFGWRGFLVPELARFMGFTELALLSAAVWTSWHFPMMFFGTYHGTGSIWYSLAVFIPSVMGAGLILAWLRLVSGSVWVAVLFHGFWNYFIQQFYPVLTTTTDAGQAMLGEFGWFVAVFYIALAFVFWYFRDRLPELPAENV
ncbi:MULTISPECIES: CPBP family intramembrane glutamic endopeptidase [unclassified Methanoregula]|uniref:CPBP family intramembrane glutamic endopeptidase n=1 Tax=unclassified Methanoregula TaxID=2649730 RepID=UPI0009C5A6BC|nr:MULTISPECIES: type II CAAX endopeptidase family protein [unclassified Methanoregula]OPX64301.1 MAG: CAAX amino terminal protease self- immunity [Methanoregula sp. PtaB.Bin085]OPY33574.1 MAG: CAAX amino terminal protease self- immunity [Methanoregula sp. PtaU1.Bin006]